MSKIFPAWPQPEEVRVPVSEPNLSGLERSYLLEAFDSGWIGSSSAFVKRAEQALASFLGVADALAVSNGSVALILALKALGIGRGHEVIVPALTYAATASSILHVGASPVFCDVAEHNWQASLTSIAEATGPLTKAIVLPHTYGVPGPVREVMEFAGERGIKVIEDCAEALGARIDGAHVGTIGDIGTFSFFPNKLITSGEGGLVTARSKEVLQKMRLLRGQGMSPDRRYFFEEPGFNFRMSGLQAAVLLAQTERLEDLLLERSGSEYELNRALGRTVLIPSVSSANTRAPWIYSGRIRSSTPNVNLKFAMKLARNGIESRPVFWPLNSMPAFAACRSINTPVAEQISSSAISLPSGTHVDANVVSEMKTILDSTLESMIM